jgi:hypothetical protein
MDYGISINTNVRGLSNILSSIMRGIIQIPPFQREFVWSREQVKDLFDSIQKNYPIGSVLLWCPKEPQRKWDCSKQIGPFSIPKGKEQNFYLLDGYQRFSCLAGCLINPNQQELQTDYKRYNEFFNLYYDLKEEAFFYPRQNQQKPWQVPVYVLMSTSEFRRYARQYIEPALKGSELTQCLDKADVFSRILLEYKMAVVEVQDASLSEAVNIFSRINSTGTDISPDWMLHALTYSDNFNFSLEMDSVIEQLEKYHFHRIPRIQLFRCYQSGFNNKLYFDQSNMEELAQKEDFSATVKRISQSILKAVQFLAEEVGVTDYKLLPYNMQLFFLTMFFKEVAQPTKVQIKDLRRWFWITSYAGYFTVYSMPNQRRAFNHFMKYAHGEEDDILYMEERMVPFRVSSFPESYSRMSVRCKSLVLFLQQHAVKVLGLSSPQEWVMKKVDKESPNTTLNTLVIPRYLEDKVASVSTWEENLKKAFFIPPYTHGKECTSERMALIRQSEYEFVRDLGLEYELDSSIRIHRV